MSWRLSWLPCATAIVLASWEAFGEPVLHEYVPAPESEPTPQHARPPSVMPRDTAATEARRSPPTPRPSAPPTAREAAKGELPPPRTSTPTAPRRERSRGEPRATARSTRFRTDRDTALHDPLRYVSEFDPTVVPFKRVSAFDTIDRDYALRVRSPELERVHLTPRPTPPDRQAFRASMLLHTRRGAPLPIASVAPDAVLIEVRSMPAVEVRFFRDSADNLWIRTPHTGPLRLTLTTDAPRHYFSPDIPRKVTTDDVPAHLRPRVPRPVQRAAGRVLQHIGISPAPIHQQLERMVAYFRNFEVAELPPSASNDYLDISLTRRGVCRHRSHAFVISAQAMGLPARLVHNEAHVFAEVYVPRMGWARIDLGGASDGLEVAAAESKELHRPGSDPFPRPHAYASAYQRLLGRIRDLQKTGAPMARANQARSTESRISAPSKLPTQVTLRTAPSRQFRGKKLRVWGNVTSRGQGVARMRVDIYLGGQGDDHGISIGIAVTSRDGSFQADLPIPLAMAVGDYHAYAVVSGDDRYRRSASR